MAPALLKKNLTANLAFPGVEAQLGKKVLLQKPTPMCTHECYVVAVRTGAFQRGHSKVEKYYLSKIYRVTRLSSRKSGVPTKEIVRKYGPGGNVEQGHARSASDRLHSPTGEYQAVRLRRSS